MTATRTAAPPGRPPPGSDEGHRWHGAPHEQSKADAPILADLDAERKAFSTLQARAALGGNALHRLESGAYLLTRWGFSRELRTLREVAALIDRIAGVRP